MPNYKYYSLPRGCVEPREIDLKSAITQIEGQGSLNGKFQIEQSNCKHPGDYQVRLVLARGGK